MRGRRGNRETWVGVGQGTSGRDEGNQEWMGVGDWAGGGEWVHVGVGGEEPVPVVLVSWKVIDLSGMPHTLRTDTWQV